MAHASPTGPAPTTTTSTTSDTSARSERWSRAATGQNATVTRVAGRARRFAMSGRRLFDPEVFGIFDWHALSRTCWGSAPSTSSSRWPRKSCARSSSTFSHLRPQPFRQARPGPAQSVRFRRPADALEHRAERHHRQRHVAARRDHRRGDAARHRTRCWCGSSTAAPTMAICGEDRRRLCLIRHCALETDRPGAAAHQRRRAHRPGARARLRRSSPRSRPRCSIRTARST